MPKISVIVPVYNVEPYLSRCIDSVLNQTYRNFELILVDDGSPDNCGKICDEYAEKFSNIVVIHKENGGLSDARNKGIDWAIKKSDSEFITFIDSDDWVHPDYLKFLYEGIETSNCNISICKYAVADNYNGRFCELLYKQKVLTPEEFWVFDQVNATVAWGKLYKKSLFSDIKFPFGKLHEDEFTTYRLLFKCEKIVMLVNELYFYYQNQNGIMKSSWSPKHIDKIYAFQNQVHFFKNNSFEKAYIFSINCLIYALKETLISAQENKADITLIYILKFKLFICTERYKKVISLSESKYRVILKLIFPKWFKLKNYVKKKLYNIFELVKRK